MKIRYDVLFFIILVWFSVPLNVQCIMEKIFNNQFTQMISSFFTPASDAEYPSLVLAVDKSKNCIIANVPIITNRMGPYLDKYLFACPAESKQDMDINDKHSITKNALFIKASYENPINAEEDKKKKKTSDVSESDKKDSEFIEYDCLNPILPSIRHLGTVTENGLEIEFHVVGFEVYIKGYEKLKVTEYLNKELGLKEDFAWLNLLIIRYDRKGGNVLSVTCEMYNDRLNIKPPTTTEAEKNLPDDLWKDYFYDNKNYKIASTYDERNQEEVFQKLFNKTPLLDQYFEPKLDRRLVKVHLVPLDSFVHPVLALSARTYGNIAPMWDNIRRNSWFRVEEYVRHIVQGVYGIFVITGTYGTLSLKNKYIYLGSNDNVKVPLAFWKIITYTKKANQFYNILIVTMNNPYENRLNVLCETSQCEETGWEYIERDDIPMGRTFCCEITPEILKELHIKEGAVKIERVLNLKKVPHWEKENLTLDLNKFIQDQINKQTGRTIRADDVEYRNEKITLDRDLESKNKVRGDEGMSITGFFSSIFTDFIPSVVRTFLPTFSNTKSDDIVVEKS